MCGVFPVRGATPTSPEGHWALRSRNEVSPITGSRHSEAVVVHGRNTRRGVGLRFVDLSPRQAEIIEEFIERNEALAS